MDRFIIRTPKPSAPKRSEPESLPRGLPAGAGPGLSKSTTRTIKSSAPKRSKPENLPAGQGPSTSSASDLDVIIPVQPRSTHSPTSATAIILDNEGEDISDNNEDFEEPEPLTKKKKWYKHKFNESWKKKFSWVMATAETETLCKVCNIKVAGSISNLKRHDISISHQNYFKAAASTPSVAHMLSKPAEKTLDIHSKEGELKMAMFLAEHNLPFSLMDHLPQLISSVCPDSKIAGKLKKSIKRKKGTQLVVNVLGPANVEDLLCDLRENYFSIIVDETTDISTTKCLAIVVRYYKNQSVVDRFFDLVEIKSSTALDIFNAIEERMTKSGIGLQNIIGLGADNCNVMMGNINGVKALFEKVNPHIVTLGCACHSFHLCSSHACEKLPKSVEQLARDIYNYFSNSSKRCVELRECEIFANEKPHSMLRPSQTRWLSLQSVVTRILEHWASLELFFTRAALEDNIPSAISILNCLRNPIYKVYFLFLSYILEVVNQLNLEFQSEAPKVHVLLSRIKSLYRLILKSFLLKDVLTSDDLNKINVNNPRNYLPLDQIYCGAKVDLMLKNTDIDPREVNSFRIRVLDFYIELSNQIKKRFDLNDSVLKFVSQFDPKIVIEGAINSISEAEDLFPYLDLDVAKLDFEYRLLSETEELKKLVNCDVTFWSNVDSLRNSLNGPLFGNVMKVARIILSLPHSSAAAERIFSQLSLIKNPTRNKLLIKTSSNLLHCKDMLGVQNKKCFEWTPSAKMLRHNRLEEEITEDITFINNV